MYARVPRLIEGSVTSITGAYAAGDRVSSSASVVSIVGAVTKSNATSDGLTVGGTYVGDVTRAYTVTVTKLAGQAESASVYAATEISVANDIDNIVQLYPVAAGVAVTLDPWIGLTLTFAATGTTTALGDFYTFTATAARSIKFAAAMNVGNTCRLKSARLETAYTVTTNDTTNIRFRLHLYRNNIAGLALDNVAYALLTANRANYIGYLDFPPTVTEDTATSTKVIAQLDGIDWDVVGQSGGKHIFGALEARDAFTSVANQVIYIELVVE